MEKGWVDVRMYRYRKGWIEEGWVDREKDGWMIA